jgi:hypothetical protein
MFRKYMKYIDKLSFGLIDFGPDYICSIYTGRKYLGFLDIIPKVLDIDLFHGRDLVPWVGAARSAIPELSGKRRNDPRGEIRATGGRPHGGPLAAPFGSLGGPLVVARTTVRDRAWRNGL